MPDRRALIPLIVVVVAIVVALLVFGGGAQHARSNAPTSASSGAAAANGTQTSGAATATAQAAKSPATVASAAASGHTRTLFTAPWGNKDGELGRKGQAEGNPEAPMSLVVGKDGTAYVLDQVNGRVARFDENGKPLAPIPVHLRGAQDLALSKDGSVLVMDRVADKQIAIIGADGKVKASLSVEGKGIEEGGAATGVFTDGDKVYVEREHQQLVSVGDTSGNADPDRKEIPGRPTRDGTGYLNAYLTSVPGHAAIVTFTQRDPEVHRFTRQLSDPLLLTGIVLLDSDMSGTLYLGLLTEHADAEGNAASAPSIEIWCLEPEHGAPIGSVTVPANTSPYETFRELTVLDEGGVLYLSRSDAGASLQRLDCK